jgi:hypothetical protein
LPAVAVQHDVAEILEPRVLRVMDVAACEATTSAFFDPVKKRNWSNWWDAMSQMMPP